MNFAIKEADLMAYDDRGRMLLMVEVKSLRNTPAEWAAKFRRNLLSHGTFPFTRFFMIATLDGLYFWHQEDESISTDALPQFTMDAARELNPYIERLGFASEKISRPALRLVVFSWLQDLAWSEQSRVAQDPQLHWLSESG